MHILAHLQGAQSRHTQLTLQKSQNFFQTTNNLSIRPFDFAKFVRMTQALNLQPIDNELPSHFADRLGILYAKTVTTQHKKDNEQFFTPTGIAHFMARLVNQTKDKLKILDACCGTAILSSLHIETIITDKDILPCTQATLDYLKAWIQKMKIGFKAPLDTNDFVLENKDCFKNFQKINRKQK